MDIVTAKFVLKFAKRSVERMNERNLKRKKFSREEISNFSHNEIIEYIGVPFNHWGGLEATKRLLTAMQIKKNKEMRILDIGCGSGYTACMISQEFGCSVIGIDISEYMIIKAKERAEKLKLSNVEFKVADALNLPFEDNYFDAAIAESVTLFLPDKQQALREYLRVVKPGEYFGNGEVYLKESVSPEVVNQIHTVSREIMTPQCTYLTKSEWTRIFEESGLQELQIIKLPDEINMGRNVMEGVGLARLLKFVLKAYWYIIVNKQIRRTMLKFKKLDSLTTARKGKKYLNTGYLIAIGKKPKI